MGERKLTRKSFVAWLREKPPRTVVGHRRKTHDCPIACFLGPDDVKVYVSRYWIGARAYDSPLWARRFVMAVDDHQKQLTAASCLKALGEDPS